MHILRSIMPLQDLLKGLCGPTGKQASHTMRDKCVRTSAICILNPPITKARLNYQALCFTLYLGFSQVYLHQDNFDKVLDLFSFKHNLQVPFPILKKNTFLRIALVYSNH